MYLHLLNGHHAPWKAPWPECNWHTPRKTPHLDSGSSVFRTQSPNNAQRTTASLTYNGTELLYSIFSNAHTHGYPLFYLRSAPQQCMLDPLPPSQCAAAGLRCCQPCPTAPRSASIVAGCCCLRGCVWSPSRPAGSCVVPCM